MTLVGEPTDDEHVVVSTIIDGKLFVLISLFSRVDQTSAMAELGDPVVAPGNPSRRVGVAIDPKTRAIRWITYSDVLRVGSARLGYNFDLEQISRDAARGIEPVIKRISD